MFGPIEFVVFDLDGTLVNSLPSVIKGLQEAVALGTGKTVSAEELLKTFGPAPLAVLSKWVPEERLKASHDHWLDFERARGPESFTPFAGIQEMLVDLKSCGLKLAIFTGRDREGTLRILNHHGWMKEFFDPRSIVCGDDGFEVKPKPDALLHLIRTIPLVAERTLMVGDHPYDMQAGKASGTKTAAALWDLPSGHRSNRARFREAWGRWDGIPCDLRLESPLSLREWFRQRPAK